MRKIDCHTHIINEKIRDEYFSRTDNPAIVMQFPESILENPDTVRTVQGDPRLFLCPCVDLKREIAPQLRNIEAHLDEWKVVGLKIYTSYQAGRADGERMLPMELALIRPDRNDFARIWRYISSRSRRFAEEKDTLLPEIALRAQVPAFGRILVCLRVFDELGLIRLQEQGDLLDIRIPRFAGKADLNESKILQRLR